MTDDQGYGVSGTFGGVIPTPALDRVAKAGLRYTQFNSTALCSPTRAALITGRNHHAVGFGVISELSTGYPGYDSIIGPDNATIGRILRGERLRDVVVRQESQHARVPVQRVRSVRPVAVGHGLPVLLRLHGRRDRPVDAVSVPRPHADLPVDRQARTTTSPPTSRTRRSATCAASTPLRPSSRSSSTTCPAAATRRTSRRRSGSRSSRASSTWAGRSCATQIFANQKRLGVIPGEREAHAVARPSCRSGRRSRC